MPLETFGLILMVLGGVGVFLCFLWLLFVQFHSSLLWGTVCVFMPVAMIAWLAIYWDEGKQPFGYTVVFALLLFGGSAMSGIPLGFHLPSL